MAIEEHMQMSNTNTKSSKKMKMKKAPQRGLGVAQLERIRLEEQHKKDSIFQSLQCLNSIPTSSRIDFSSKDSVFRPNQSAPFILDSLESFSQTNNHHGIVFGHNLNLPSEPHNLIFPVLQRSQQYHQTSSSSSMVSQLHRVVSTLSSLTRRSRGKVGSTISVMGSHEVMNSVNISSGISSSSSSVQKFQMEPPSNQSYYGCTNCLPLRPAEVKMAGVKRPYPFSPECPPVPLFRCKFPQCSVASVSRSRESSSSSNGCSVNVEEGNLLKREVVSKSRALSESGPSISVRETKALNGDFLRLPPPAAALPHLEGVNRRSLTNSAPHTLELFNYVPSQVAAAEPTPPSGLSISVEQPILRFFPSAEVQIGREGTRGSGFHTEVGGDVDLDLKL